MGIREADAEERIAARTASFLHDVESGVPLGEALGASWAPEMPPEIVRVATEMLAATGEVDMKQLARDVGLSRASLYRRYPDRRQLESEIAAKGAERMLDAANGITERGARLRAHAEYLLDHPGEAAAIIKLTTSSSVAVVRAASMAMAGNAADATWILGFAVMAATPDRGADDEAAMLAYIDEMVAELS